MKTKSNHLIVILKYTFDVIWYMSIILFVVINIGLIVANVNSGNKGFNFSLDVEYRGKLEENYKTVNNETVSFVPSAGKLNLPIENDKSALLGFHFFFLCLSAPVFLIIFNLRKFFSTTLKDSPFNLSNVKNLRIIGYCFIVINIIALIFSKIYAALIINKIIDFPYVSNWVVPRDFKYFIIAAFIFILAGIFKYGYEIQEENKEFI